MASNVRSLGLRLALLVAIGLGGGLGVAVLMVLPEVLQAVLPGTVRRHPVEWSILGLFVADSLTRRLALKEQGGAPVLAARRILDPIHSFLKWAWRGAFAVALGVLTLGMLISWAPQYLTWPWCRDPDTFAALAQMWDAGIFPYRDVLFYNFPGHVYLHWVLGKVFGWGGTVAFYAVDAALVILLGIVLAVWSRRRFGQVVPGLVAYLGFLGFYLGLDYLPVAQRDWHTALGVALGLMVVEAWPGRWGMLGSALAVALAFSIRPHAVLFLPALASAIVEGARRPDDSWLRTAQALGVWALACALFVGLAFAPLFASGIFGDFVQGLRLAMYGGSYGNSSRGGALSTFVNQFGDWRVSAVLASLVLLAVRGPLELRRTARTWFLAMVGALVYRPMHPMTQHAYLAHPLALMGSIALAPIAAWLARTAKLADSSRLLAVALVLFGAIPGIPRFCRPVESLRALGPLVRGEEPARPPLGSLSGFPRSQLSRYPWTDYLGVLHYLRSAIKPETRVANLLRHPPFPSLNGPTGRLSPFPADSGICWMWFVRMDIDPEFAEALERENDAVVVWVPDETGIVPRMRYPRVVEVVRRRFRPEAKFGPIEVWRREPGPSVEAQSSD
ncbi:MAG: hypothetical protein ABI353_08685 [Isosphaeraceae bacterium]